MKSVLISIQPKWVEKICHEIGKENGKPIYEKVVEVRKTRPKIETPFKCYIYMTKNGSFNDFETDKNKLSIAQFLRKQGKVIGEFVCDMIYEYPYSKFGYEISEGSFNATMLTAEEFCSYGKQKPLYGWHISDLKIYDKPKDLSEFKSIEKFYRVRKNTIGLKGGESLKRPFQSWGYVESLGE